MHETFHPLVQEWFRDRFSRPTEPQIRSWPLIRAGGDVLVSAPTGSGKTLAAFLSCLDDLVCKAAAGTLPEETLVVYVSPLKALTNDVRKNLELPLAELQVRAVERGLALSEIRTAVRTGDTPASERQKMLRKPPHVLVTTPESLYILLTAAKSRELFRNVSTIVVDEIHAMANSKRGSHLALTLALLDDLVVSGGAPKPQRIGLSATIRPLERVATFLSPTAEIVDVGSRREMDLSVEVPSDELGAVASGEMWQEIYDKLAALVQANRTTLIFVPTRRMSERVAFALTERLGEGIVMPHHGSLSREGRFEAENRLKNGELRGVVATASLELGIDIGTIDLVVQLGSPRSIATALQRIGRSGHWVGAKPRGKIFATTRDELIECAALVRSLRGGEMDALCIPVAPLDILAQQMVAACATREWAADELYALVKTAYPYRDLPRSDFDEVVSLLADGVTMSRGRSGTYLHYDRVNGVLRARRGARMAAITCGGAIPDTANFKVVAEPDGHTVGTLDEDFAVESLAGDIFLLGTNSWRIRRVETGVVRVEDAHGAPPTIPFWNGEGLGRTIELSREVSDCVPRSTSATTRPHTRSWRTNARWISPARNKPSPISARRRPAWASCRPTQTIVAERFFDEGGGMQLILHTPFGARINRAWGLALRKRFCVSFNFELQAAATDNGINISLAEQHAFPLDAVFEYVKAASVEKVLTQAMLPAPMFEARWRWNATRSLDDPAHARRPQSGAAALAHASRRFARVRLSGSGGLSRKPDRTDPHSRPRAGARDGRQLLARSDGSRRTDRDLASHRRRNHSHGRHRHGRAVGVQSRDPQRESVRVSRRRSAGRAARARGAAATRFARRFRRRRHSRSGRDRRGDARVVAARARCRRTARRAGNAWSSCRRSPQWSAWFDELRSSAARPRCASATRVFGCAPSGSTRAAWHIGALQLDPEIAAVAGMPLPERPEDALTEIVRGWLESSGPVTAAELAQTLAADEARSEPRCCASNPRVKFCADVSAAPRTRSGAIAACWRASIA